MRNLVYYVGASIDGIIAGPRGEFDFLPVDAVMTAWIGARYPETIPAFLRESVGLAVDEPNREFDTILMGRGTYEPGLSVGITNPYPHLKQYVISGTLAQADFPDVEIVSGDPVELVRRLKKEEGRDVWLCGGGKLAGELIDEIDQLVIKTYPVIAGAGVRLFDGEFHPSRFRVTRREAFENDAQVTWLDRVAAR
ncbi:dihydrofolate reductase [Nocardia sp. NPDC052001]|uniref:dihydrofolate reductase family protein n=1 Tax=Nocardia sp. NPDC052001 TaxID=3154853 RepID=UPI00344AC4C3